MKKSVKKKKKPAKRAKGTELFEQVVAMTGLPGKSIQRELKSILERKNIDVRHLTLEQLRDVVASYLREIMGGLLDKVSPRRSDPTH